MLFSCFYKRISFELMSCTLGVLIFNFYFPWFEFKIDLVFTWMIHVLWKKNPFVLVVFMPLIINYWTPHKLKFNIIIFFMTTHKLNFDTMFVFIINICLCFWFNWHWVWILSFGKIKGHILIFHRVINFLLFFGNSCFIDTKVESWVC